MDKGYYQVIEEKEWFLEGLMIELINDNCDINIAVNGIPLVLYAYETNKIKSMDLIIQKGLDWKRFVGNCRNEGVI